MSALLVSASMIACGGDDSISISDLGPELVDAYCDRAVRCGYFVDDAACHAFLEPLLSFEEAERSVEAGRVNYDGEKAAACIEALRSASCDVTAEDNRAPPAACDEAFEGTIADGGQCFTSDECVSNSCEVPSCNMACCTGTCAPSQATPRIGEPCQGFCEEGAFCNSAGTCAALLTAGSTCNDDDECGYGLYCPDSATPTCTDAPNRGQPCPAGLCADLGDRCDAGTGTCVALSGRGGPCSEGFAGFLDCQTPLVCNQTSLTCENPPSVGQPCDFYCTAGAFCNDSSTCEAVRSNGSACDGDNECASNYCDDFAATPVCADEPICG